MAVDSNHVHDAALRKRQASAKRTCEHARSTRHHSRSSRGRRTPSAGCTHLTCTHAATQREGTSRGHGRTAHAPRKLIGDRSAHARDQEGMLQSGLAAVCRCVEDEYTNPARASASRDLWPICLIWTGTIAYRIHTGSLRE
eukprot:4386624-Prymnesium_polylepis.1